MKCASSVVALLLLSLSLVRSQVVISEIMYHPVEEPEFQADGTPMLDLSSDVHEFIELHNPTSAPVSLGGWRISGGIQFTFPANTTIKPGEFLVVAKDKARLARVAVYALMENALFGPYEGELSNREDTLRLRDPNNQIVDSVSYSASFPWAIGADGLGAGEEWTGLKQVNFQHRGRSLERVSFVVSGDDPANWVASPVAGNPSPGHANTIRRALPKPVVVNLHISDATNGQLLIRKNRPARVDCLFSSTNALSLVKLEYFVDNIEVTNEVAAAIPMFRVGNVAEGHYAIDLPGLPDRLIVRYRIRANRGEGDEVISPRSDDPFRWHAYFISPELSSTNQVYDLFISTNSLRKLEANISQNPRRITSPDPPGYPRAAWNATEPAVFVHDGVVFDVRMRHHGSKYNRSVGRRSYKIQFPNYAPFKERTSLFVTDKDYITFAGHAVFREVGLPTSLPEWIDLYMNGNPKLIRLELEEYDQEMLERYHREQRLLHPVQPMQKAGELYKSVGGFDSEGPFGPGEGTLLIPRPRAAPIWSPLQRYEWTYSLQNHGWVGHLGFKEMIDGLWAASNGRSQKPSVNEVPTLRKYFSESWDLDKTLTYLATINWMSVWDDISHNYFLWRQTDGRWSMLPWDFDDLMRRSPTTSILNPAENSSRTNAFKQSFITAYQAEFISRAWRLNNTLLHPDHIATLGVSTQIQSWSKQRFASVNSQCALGPFERPTRPLNLMPADGGSVGPFDVLRASDYAYSTNPVSPHASTTWVIRSAKGSYYAPVYVLTTTNLLTTLPVPSRLLELGEAYFWRCVYTSADEHPSIASVETSFTVGRPMRQSNDIVINEIVANNQSAPGSKVKRSDWIELYNPSEQPQSLQGFAITDDFSVPQKFSFSNSTVILPRSYLVIWCDNETGAPGLHTGFGLKAEGETVALFTSSTNGPVLKDIVTFGLQLPAFSIGRFPDGVGDWALNIASPNAANRPQPLGNAANLKINEWMANPASGNDWFEIYNPEPLPVLIGELHLTDNLKNSTNSPVAPLSYIGAGEWQRFLADGQARQGADHTAFRLNANSGSLALYTAEGTLVDSVLYGTQTIGVAQGRVPDGAPAIFSLNGSGTPGRSNWIDSDTDGLPDQWELANGFDPLRREASLDSDADGQTDLQEYLSGTNPRDSHSHLEIESARLAVDGSGQLQLYFTAAPGRSYTVQFCESLEPGRWQKLTDIASQSLPHRIELTDPASSGNQGRYYRIVTPSQPPK